ncbi:MAG: T9SS type A sorting domain-containing protein [Bacteroidia bacterium]
MLRFTIISIVCLILSFVQNTNAQSTYTEIQYEIRVDTSIYFGTSTNYAGNPIDLYLDLYKPLGDENRYRPLVILSFGGAWIGGDKRSSDVTSIAPWFASRGYAVAAIDYRLGFHPSTGSGSNWVTCPAVTQESNCVYPADSNEVIRAIYRGMQDLKGAIRFLKARNADDSTCVNNVFIAGVSAGGFNTIAAGFLDSESEKPLAAFELTDAPGPPNALNYCHQYYNEANAPVSRSRPDLGSIDGSIAQNGYNAEVKGVVNFIGGMLNDYFAVETGSSPLFYTHHQTSDLIVSCSRTPLLSSLSYTCLDPFGFLGCNHVWNMPRASGSCNIVDILEQNNYPITFMDVISQTGGPNCLQDPPGHSVVNPPLRVQEITEFFSSEIQQNEADGCDFVTNATDYSLDFKVYPIPTTNALTVEIPPSFNCKTIELLDISGRVVQEIDSDYSKLIVINFTAVKPGIYFIKLIEANASSITKSIVKSN